MFRKLRRVDGRFRLEGKGLFARSLKHERRFRSASIRPDLPALMFAKEAGVTLTAGPGPG